MKHSHLRAFSRILSFGATFLLGMYVQMSRSGREISLNTWWAVAIAIVLFYGLSLEKKK